MVTGVDGFGCGVDYYLPMRVGVGGASGAGGGKRAVFTPGNVA